MAAPSSRQSSLLRWDWAVFAFALLIRLWVLSRYATTPYSGLQMGDMKFYHEWAVRVLGGQWSDGAAFYGLPGYAYLLAGFYKLLGGDFPIAWMAVAVVQSLWEGCTAVLIFIIARKCCNSEKRKGDGAGERQVGPLVAALLASFAYIFYVPGQAFSIILMPTAWAVCAYWFCVWQAMRPREGRSPWPWLGLGFLVGVVAMMIATILFALPMLLLAIALRVAAGEPVRSRFSRAALAAVLLLAGVLAGTSPAWLHNYFIAKDPVLLSAHSGLNFYMGNNADANGYPKIPQGLRPSQEGLLRDSIKWAERDAGRPLKRTEVSRYWSAKANAYIAEHPGDWLRLMGTKIRNFWNGFQYDDISVVRLMEERSVATPGPHFGILAVLGLAGMLACVWANPPARWVAAAVLLHMGALLSVFITERYRLAAVPGLAILGACGLWRLALALRERRWQRAATVIVLLVVAAFATNGATSDPSLLSLEPYNLGVKELEVAEGLLARGGSPEEKAANRQLAEQELTFAQQHLETAYRHLPGNDGIVFALGNFALARGDREGARTWYRKTLEINPHYTGALKNLGYLAVEDHDFAPAAAQLEQARDLEASNPTTWYLLARAYAGLGRVEEARGVLQEALRLRPAQPEFLALQQQLASSPTQP